MTSEEQQRIEACITEIAEILYNNTPPEKTTLMSSNRTEMYANAEMLILIGLYP
ncbi:hypothetical protein H6F61_11505 [Cyanobacteria bacterium FACHB-472]|nr:hypothetical protein [Cyanobacteria bacterium FACHB-472]